MATVAPPAAAAAAERNSKRASCLRCQRPPRVCYCASLPTHPLATALTHVLVVQHRHEKRHRNAISSVPVLAQVLNAQAVTVVSVEDAGLGAPGTSQELDSLLYHVTDDGNGDIKFDCVFVLFPDAAAKTLNAELMASLVLSSPSPVPSVSEPQPIVTVQARRTLLVVIDGTWTEAKKIVFHARANLDALAQQRRAMDRAFEFVCLENDASMPPRRSIYGDLRREPMDGCLSTLEAVALALRVLEPRGTSELLYGALLCGFRGMVAIQTQFMNQGKQQTLDRYKGVSKRDAILKRQQEQQQGQQEQEEQQEHHQELVLRREYVFVATHMDFRQRKQLVQQGESVTCTYDEARMQCQERNKERKRGQRLAVLPREVFLQHQQEE